MWFALLLVLGLSCAASDAAAASRHDIYRGYKVWRVSMESEWAVVAVVAAAAAADAEQLQRGAPARPATYMTQPHREQQFLAALDRAGVSYSLMIDDVPRELKQREAERLAWRKSRNQSAREIPFEDYPRYAEIVTYLQYLSQRYSDRARLLSAGTSFEGRDIPYMLVSSNFSESSRPLVFVEAALHAREWVTPAAALFALHRLLDAPADDGGEGADALRAADWLVLPLANPDGYEYTHTHERLWRRTRSIDPNSPADCVGVDANRNFDVAWNTTGVSSNPCSNTYPGPEPFSEPECRHVRDLLLEYANRTQVFVDVHSHGNYVLYGWGDGSLPAGAATRHHAAAAAGAAMDAHRLPDDALYYLVGNSGSQLYATSGTAQDYGQLLGIPISLTFELPGLGYAFEVPPQLMPGVNRGTWAGFLALARLARAHHQTQLQLD